LKKRIKSIIKHDEDEEDGKDEDEDEDLIK